MKTIIRKAYEKRRNIWRSNIPWIIRRNKRVPDWFENINSFRNLRRIRKPGSFKYITGNWFLRFIQFIKKLFKRRKP